MNVVGNLEKWQKIAGAILITVSVAGLVPSSWYLMTRGAHEDDSRYTEETVAAKNIQYFEKKLCNMKTGKPNGKALSTFRLRKLNAAYAKYEEVASEPFPLQALSSLGKCRALFEDEL
jgi:hypothetical protein